MSTTWNMTLLVGFPVQSEDEAPGCDISYVNDIPHTGVFFVDQDDNSSKQFEGIDEKGLEAAFLQAYELRTKLFGPEDKRDIKLHANLWSY